MEVSITTALRLLGKGLGVQLADLSSVPDPVGRVDYLASKFVEQGVKGLPPEAQMTYHAMRPLIDGLISKQLGSYQVQVPDEVREMFARKGQEL